MNIEQLASIAAIGATEVAAVNVIMEVLKSFWLKKETHRPPVVLMVSVLMSFAVVYAFCVLKNVAFTPLLAIGALVGGFLVSYGAMFGYDKLYGDFIVKLKSVMAGERLD